MGTKAQQLLNLLKDSFSREPEIFKINIFGRLAENIADEYSDVDIRIISKDPGLTQSKLHRVIEKNISPIIGTFILASDVNCFAEMIMLRDYTPYQKIDISVEREGFGIEFKPIVTIYQNIKSKGKDKDCQIIKFNKAVDYNLKNFLFGVPRIIKCFFRKDFDMYRRWKDQTNTLLVLLNEKYNGWEKVREKKELGANEAKQLFHKLNKEDRNRLLEVFPLDGNLNIPLSYLYVLDFYIFLAGIKAKTQNVSIDDRFVFYIFDFAKREIKRLKSEIVI